MAYTISDLRELVRARSYVVSHHGAEELEDDNLAVLDLENVVLSGQIFERQKDPRTHETKYVVRGSTLDGRIAEAVVKIGVSGRLIFITVYVV